MKYIIIVNGKPGSGKTTFQRKCKEYLELDESAQFHSISSIDYIKDVYRALGWNSVKTDKARKDLSILKQMWIDNCNGPLNQLFKYVVELPCNEDHMIFVDVREESEIIKYVETFQSLRDVGIICTTLFISRPESDFEEFGNKSDDNAGKNMSLYKYNISNIGTIDDLDQWVEEFINRLPYDNHKTIGGINNE